eukprot:5541353-Ditylum_brightwellii.AAC.1
MVAVIHNMVDDGESACSFFDFIVLRGGWLAVAVEAMVADTNAAAGGLALAVVVKKDMGVGM